MIEIGFSWRGKICFSHTASLDPVLVSISQGTEVTIVTEYVFRFAFVIVILFSELGFVLHFSATVIMNNTTVKIIITYFALAW